MGSYLDDIGLGGLAPWVAAAWESLNNALADKVIDNAEYFRLAGILNDATAATPQDEEAARGVWEEVQAIRARSVASDVGEAISDAVNGAVDAVADAVPWQVWALLALGVVVATWKR